MSFIKFKNIVNENLRTLENSNKIFNSIGIKDKMGFVIKPIFDFIDFNKIHHDPLHEKARIIGILLDLTLREIVKLIYKTKKIIRSKKLYFKIIFLND